MSRKRFSNKRYGISAKGQRWVFLVVAVALCFPGNVRPEGKKETILFAYSDVLQEKVKLDGDENSIGRGSDGASDGWVDMVIDTANDGGVYIVKKLDMDVGAKMLNFSVKVNEINDKGRDYEPAKAQYPFFLQLVFERAPGGISLRKRFFLWIKSLRFRKIEIRQNIIYVFGNRMPKESIVNPYPGCAIISIGDERDVGRLIHVTRDLDDDYLLAFGDEMETRLRKIVIGFEGKHEVKQFTPVSVSRFLLKPSS